jgi:hypothetical protein
MLNWILPAVLACSLPQADAIGRDASPALTLRVDPSVTMSPGTFRATAFVEPDPANRRLVLLIDSGEYYRSSTTYLEGDAAARSHQMLFKQLPPGTYTVVARLERNDGTTTSDQSEVQVVH